MEAYRGLEKEILAAFWQNAETVILEDYFFSARRLKLSHLMAELDTYPVARYFRQLLSLFHPPTGGYPAFDEAVASIGCRSPDERTVIMRSLLVRPSKKYRHLAVIRLDPYQYWPIASFPKAPVFALADILDRLRNQDISNDYRKFFFDCTFDALKAASGTSDVKAARAMVSTMSAFEFFLTRYYGAYANRTRHAPSPDVSQTTPFCPEHDVEHFSTPSRASRARLIRKIFEVGPLLCQCGAEMKVVAVITEHAVVDRIIRHVHKKTTEQPTVPRAPPPTEIQKTRSMKVNRGRGPLPLSTASC